MNTNIQEQETARAEQTVERFIRRFDQSYLYLAYHAALPLVLTPELINFLRVQFLRSENVPWVAEVDLLLSDLCRPVGYELYAMDTGVRAYLIDQMENTLGEARMRDVAKSLIGYVKYLAQTNPHISSKELQTQQWAAMVYITEKRAQAVSEITQAFQNAASTNDGAIQSLVNRAEMARLAKITEELAPQLRNYENLVKYARVVSQVLSDPTSVKEEDLRRTYQVAPKLELTLPQEFIPGEKQPTNLPILQRFEFETAKVELKKRTGIFRRGNTTEITRSRSSARFFAEPLGNDIILEMVEIPSGSFIMGAPASEEGSRDNERPQHQVNVPSFFMSKYPITQAQGRQVAALEQINKSLKPEPSRFKGDNLPVERVSWFDAVEFCARLSQYTKREYRLPSEAEWEYACRAGTNTPFYFGEIITTELANYCGIDEKVEGTKYKGSYGQGPKGEYRKQTTEVGIFPANAFGLYDMHGNVWEWCMDDWHSNYEGAPNNGSAWISKNKSTNNNHSQMLRGGSWSSYPEFCRSAFCFSYVPDIVNNSIGFRVVCVRGLL
ncbi:hypothetical protein NIES4071_86890 [Calothrix sp. NIES-4071]|nr:hypothetical protein NIES4071_86890 [Calothrix sp. NIES-4071]BAZ62956.1 hypothetical protein NIES4105_86820 [Calothrix sp. NIES-4105]